MPKSKLEDLIGSDVAKDLITTVSTYDGWREAMHRTGLARVKRDSKVTDEIDTIYQAHSQLLKAVPSDAYEHKDVVIKLAKLQNLTENWLVKKESSLNKDELIIHHRFLAMLALNSALKTKLQNLEPKIKLTQQFFKNISFGSLHARFAPPSEKPFNNTGDITNIVGNLESNPVLITKKVLEQFENEITFAWESETPVIDTLSNEITRFKNSLSSPGFSEDDLKKATHDFTIKLEQFHKASLVSKVSETPPIIKKYQDIIRQLQENHEALDFTISRPRRK